MNGNIIILIICVSVFYVACVRCERIKLLDPEVESLDKDNVGKLLGNHPNMVGQSNGAARRVDSTVHQTVNRYYCSLDSMIEGSHLMVYGSNGWTFPQQDVNLTLRYPPDDKETILHDDDEDYIITGFKVILFINGPTSEGYIMEGGVLQETITLSFISSRLTSLSYEFWLYGARKDTPGLTLNSHYRLC
ncbi:unnamed protein product [Spodoptera exigua]|nr:unnamed protein product [Spodoptera exigua]